jgi:hypothetical protein
MVSIWEILEALRRFGKMSTKDLRIEFDTSNHHILSLCYLLEGEGWIRRVGKDKNRIVWDLTKKSYSVLKNYTTFYDVPFVKKKEKIMMEKFGKKFKRWD